MDAAGETAGRQLPPGENRVPIPDPTILTTQQLYREIAALREFFAMQLRSMQEDIVLLRAQDIQFPTRIDEKIQAASGEIRFLRELFTERFTAIGTQFTNMDTARAALANAIHENFRNAMLANKELMMQQNAAFTQATAKAEQSTDTRVAQLEALVEAKIQALEQRVEVTNARLLTVEGMTAGHRTARADADMSSKYLLAVIGAIGGVILLGIAIFTALRTFNTP